MSNMNKWHIITNEKIKETCKSDNGCTSSTNYYGCCKDCSFANAERAEHWTNDRIWCSSPAALKKGQSIEVEEIKKYRVFINEKKANERRK